VLAVGRLRRLERLWAVLFGALWALALASSGWRQPILPLVWIAIAFLLIIRTEPILLALVAAAWGLSMVFLVPGARLVLGGDPVLRLFSTGVVELLAMTIVRILLLVTAWNQFLLYRLLYGTEGGSGLDPSMPPIPTVLPNPSDRTAVLARLLGFLATMASLASVPLAGSPAGPSMLALAYGGSVFAVGLGLGSAFVPTHRRAMALWGVGLGCAALLALLLVGRALYPV
jgi:hypothetical protein